MRKTIFGLFLFLCLAPVARMDYDTVELCQARLNGYFYSYLGLVPSPLQDMADSDIKDKCMRRIVPGYSILPKDKTAYAQAVQLAWEKYAGNVVAWKIQVINKAVEVQNGQDTVEKGATFIQGLIDYARSVRDILVGSDESSDIQWVREAAGYIVGDYAVFATGSAKIKADLIASIPAEVKTCHANQYLGTDNLCHCGDGYRMDAQKGKCVTTEKIVELSVKLSIPIHSHSTKFGRKWACDRGWWLDKSKTGCLKRG